MKATLIVLVPKAENAINLDKYKPISLTNELYNIITQIIVNRLKPFMAKLVVPMQSAFIPGRSIADNVLMAEDLLYQFHLNRGHPRMCLKLELVKAYDSLRWDFLESALRVMSFPHHLIGLIMTCVKEPQFSIFINCKAAGYFKSSKGLRQGCPLCPFLFTTAMEFFSSMLSSCAESKLIPTPFCKGGVSISHPLFADDVIIFHQNSPQAAKNLKALLDDFH